MQCVCVRVRSHNICTQNFPCGYEMNKKNIEKNLTTLKNFLMLIWNRHFKSTGVEFDFFYSLRICTRYSIYAIILFEYNRNIMKICQFASGNFNLLRVNCCVEKFVWVKATCRVIEIEKRKMHQRTHRIYFICITLILSPLKSRQHVWYNVTYHYKVNIRFQI